MRLLSATGCSVKACQNSTLLRPPTCSAISACSPRRLVHVPPRPRCVSFRRTFAFSSRSFQQPTPRTDHDCEPEEKTKSSVSERLQAVRAEKIWTIPNALTISRILSCPVLGYAILHDDFYVATGLLIYAGLTDLVRVRLLYFAPRSRSCIPSCLAFRSMATWHGNTTWELSSARYLTQRQTRR